MDLLHIITVVILVIIGVVIYINKRKNQKLMQTSMPLLTGTCRSAM